MKQLTLGLVLTLTCAATLFGLPRDFIELSLDGHYMLNRGTYATNTDIDPARDVFKLYGNYSWGFGGQGVLGHRYNDFSSVIVKFDYSYTPLLETLITPAEYQRFYDPLGGWDLSVWMGMRVERVFSFHSLILGMRHEFYSTDNLRSFIDIGVGFVTATYDLTVRYYGGLIDHERTVQTGFAANVGYGLSYDLSKTMDFFGRVDLNLAKIPDSRDSQNHWTGNGPWVNPVSLSFGVRKWFATPYAWLHADPR